MYTLITAATSAQAYKLKSSLTQEHIILGDYLELPAILLKNTGMIKLPNPASASYAHEMLTLCLDKNITTLYVLSEIEKVNLKLSETLFAEYGIGIVDGP
jgi:hypothetical protein